MKHLKSYSNFSKNESTSDGNSIDDIRDDVKYICAELIDDGFIISSHLSWKGEMSNNPHIVFMRKDKMGHMYLPFNIFNPKEEILRINDFFKEIGWCIGNIRVYSVRADEYISLEEYLSKNDQLVSKLAIWLKKLETI